MGSSTTANQGPLAGTTIIELAGIGPGPYCGQLFADLGADVIQVRRPGMPQLPVENRGKRSIVLDLRTPGAADLILRLVERADALIEGYRPGVAERLGIGPEACHARNAALVYGRMTGWGQHGPLSSRAGHDINYIGLTGALHAMGSQGEPPPVPLNLVGDYGGGSLFLAFGIVAAMLKARQTGTGDIVDAAIIDGVSSMFGIFRSLASIGQWTEERESNLLDGGRPYYRCYATADGRFMAVGCLEPAFFAQMLEKLELKPDDYGGQNDRVQWPRQHALLEGIFAQRDRDEWTHIFEGSDACVTPVLDYAEAPLHPHSAARVSHVEAQGIIHPRAAPRFASEEGWQPPVTLPPGAAGITILQGVGFTTAEIEALIKDGTLEVPRN